MSKYETVEARIQDEFPGWKDGEGNLVGGSITQVQVHNPHDASEVVAWFEDEDLAEKVASLLNGGSEAVTKSDIYEWLKTGKINGVGYDKTSLLHALVEDGARIQRED